MAGVEMATSSLLPLPLAEEGAAPAATVRSRCCKAAAMLLGGLGFRWDDEEVLILRCDDAFSNWPRCLSSRERFSVKNRMRTDSDRCH